MMQELDKSARFTIRCSNRKQRKPSIVYMPNRKRPEPESSELSEDDVAFKNHEKMSLYGEFLVYVVASLFIMGDF